jgi:hypothetical protein
VDNYLAQGQIEQAEQYMEAQRQFLYTQGYYIRKLNQAYFAFYGRYADSPTSVDPIGIQIKTLRGHSLSVKDFLDTVSDLTNAQNLSDVVKRTRVVNLFFQSGLRFALPYSSLTLTPEAI